MIPGAGAYRHGLAGDKSIGDQRHEGEHVKEYGRGGDWVLFIWVISSLGAFVANVFRFDDRPTSLRASLDSTTSQVPQKQQLAQDSPSTSCC